MPSPRYRWIRGEFHIRYPDLPRQGPEPDGDTITFKPDNPAFVRSLRRFGRAAADINKRGTAKIRFEAIDALETHFKETHQRLQYANQARDLMLKTVGFTHVKFFDDMPNKVESADQDFLRGFVIAVGIDGNGRILGQVYRDAAKPPCIAGKSDGDRVFLKAEDLDLSVNRALVDAGLAYGELYTSMPLTLAKHVASAVRTVRGAGKGMWPTESLNTKRKATIAGLASAEEMVMWPKLFRRVAAFFLDGFVDLADFDGWLREDPVNRDDRVLLPTGELGNMHDLVEVTGNQLGLKYDPEDLIILPDEP